MIWALPGSMMLAGTIGGGGRVSTKQFRQSAALLHWGMQRPMAAKIPIRKSKNPCTKKFVRSTTLIPTEVCPPVVITVVPPPPPLPFPPLPFPPLPFPPLPFPPLVFLLFLAVAGATCISIKPITRARMRYCCNLSIVALDN